MPRSACLQPRSDYDPSPTYPAVGGTVETGLPPLPRGVLAIDGPAALPWDRLVAALPARNLVDVRGFHRPWNEIERLTADPDGDAAFRRICGASLRDLFAELPRVERGMVVF